MSDPFLEDGHRLVVRDSDPENVAKLVIVHYSYEHLGMCGRLLFSDGMDINLLPKTRLS
jgi:hypothetical protein